MRVLVCGGRNYSDYETMKEVLSFFSKNYLKITHIIEGGATGADTLAARYAAEMGIKHTQYKAEWDKDGKAAGPIRNSRMIVEGNPHFVIAFPGGHGTKDMINKAFSAGIMLFYVGEQEDDSN